MVRRVFVVLMLSSVSLLLAPVASTTAAGGTAQNVHGFFAIDAAGPTELQIWRYALDDVAPNDGMVCDVTMAKGTGVPAADMPPIVTGACNFDHTVNLVSNLEPNTAYTFAARTRYPDGSVSEPTVRTAMTRTVGVYLTDNNRAGHIWRTTARRTGQIDNEALTVGRYGGAYVVFAQRDPAWNTTVYFTSRSPGGAWTPAVKLGVTDLELSVFVARAPSGQLVAGWTAPASVGAPGGPAYRVRPAGSSRWGPVRRVAPGTELVSLVQDTRGRVHMLTTSYPYQTLTYRTNSTGGWTGQRLPLTSRSRFGTGQLTVDPVTRRVVVAYGDKVGARSTIRVATKAAAARTFTSVYTRRTVGDASMYVPAISVTSFAGRITVGMHQVSPGASGGLYVMTGTQPWNVGGLTRIGGTTSADGRYLYGDRSPIVSAVSPTLVAITFARANRTWQPTGEGTFLSKRAYSTVTHRWTFTGPYQRSTTPYDRPTGVTRDERGHFYVGFYRSWCDLDACTGP